MKYTVDVIIEKPIDQVIELFDNPDNMKHWMSGLKSFEHLSGEPGQPGAKSLLRFQMGKREMEMIETITLRNLPEELTGTYEADGTLNISQNRFIDINGLSTKWVAENEFQFGGFMMKLMGLIMPGMFKKQTLKFMNSFKQFAEAQP